MKLPLVGQSYALRSPAAAVQQTLNLMPQFIDDPNERAKNVGILVGCPGYHLVSSAINGVNEFIKGLWSGGGRLFAVSGVLAGVATLYELGLGTYVGGNPGTGSGTIISTNALTGATEDGNPAQMFGDGNQLGIVKNGYFWVSNGGAPFRARFLISGTLNSVSNGDGTSTVTWVSGDQFPSPLNVAGAFITINGTNFLITTYTSATSLLLTEDAGNHTGASYTAPAGDFVTALTGAYLDGYAIVQRPSAKFTIAGTATTAGFNVTWVSGSFFDVLKPGDSFTVTVSPGVNALYVVDTVVSPTAITVTVNTGGAATVPFIASVGIDLGRQFNISAPFDFSSWDPLDFATKEAAADYLQSVFTDHEQLYLFGTESVEVWQNTGDPVFPIQRISGGMAKEGSIARYAPAAMAGKLFFLAGTPRGGPIAYRLDSFIPKRISTHAEEAAWASEIDIPSAAVGYCAEHDGHELWVVNFAGSLNSWVYDETASQQAGTPMWHQRARWDGAALQPYAARFHTFIPEWGPAGMHIVGDFASGNWYELNLNYFDDNGADKKWVRTLPYLYAGGKRQFFGRMTLEMETGSTASAITEPQIARDYSDDRGNTFGHIRSKGAGLTGKTSQRVYWSSNGSAVGRNFRLSGTGQYRTTLIDLDLDVTAGTV